MKKITYLIICLSIMTGCMLCISSVRAEDTEQTATNEEPQNIEVLDYETLENLNEDAFAADTIYIEEN